MLTINVLEKLHYRDPKTQYLQILRELRMVQSFPSRFF